MPEPITLSVPFVSGVAYLREALESVRAIDDDTLRVIVCENARDAQTRDDAESLVASMGDPRFSFRRYDRHVAICESMNRAMQAAETDLVALLHHDDRLLPAYPSLVRDLAGRHPQAAAYFTGFGIIDEQGRRRFSFIDWYKKLLIPGRGEIVLRGEPAVRALVHGNFIAAPTVCFRRSRLGDDGFDPALSQVADLELWTRMLFHDKTIVGTRGVGYAYRRHGQQTTAVSNATLLRFRQEAEVLDLIASRAAGRGWTSVVGPARAKRVTRLHLCFEALRDALRFSLGTAARKLYLAATLR
jgi:glycosyltransferase involved in cell wall biosynthesis